MDSPFLHMAENVANGESIDIGNILEEGKTSNKGNVSITVTGDVMFGRKMPGVLSLDSSPYRYVQNVTGDTDILLVNTENPFTTSGDAVKPDVPLKANPDYIPLINGTNGMVISANANNHVFDYGITGMRDSIKNLESYGIAHIGAGENKQEATKPVTIEKEGHNITIFNYMDSENFQEYSQSVMPIATDDSPGYSAWDDTESVEQIKQAKENGSDIILVYMHYGNEYSRSPNENQEKISHLAIDAGATAVVGAHAHVTQGIEMYNGKPIFYNLGNFMFDQSNPNTHSAYFVEFDVVNENVTANVYPVYISGYLPQFMDSSDGESLLSSLSPHCDEMEITDQGTGKINFSIKNSTE
ncbi:MAG: CapA family protein [Methanosphaera sp.]|nr:CapA family protein [Methanosphaera sp.]